MFQTTRIINSSAPTRICDNGGWTDTWFARHGAVFNIAVNPAVQVQVRARAGSPPLERIKIFAPDCDGGDNAAEAVGCRFVDAAMRYLRLPPELEVEVSICSRMPPGSSTGTSSALIVALVAALARFRSSDVILAPAELAVLAHRIETEAMGQECGVQDQIAAAYGGINLIEISPYPRFKVTPVRPPNAIKWELERRLTLVCVGQGHCSSDIHHAVIRDLCASSEQKLRPLRESAARAAQAVADGDLVAFGKAMIRNTDAQAELHPELVGKLHQRVIEIARQHGALGWKVNGAGGAGGSVTILHGPETRAQVETCDAIEAATRRFQIVPTSFCDGGAVAWDVSDEVPTMPLPQRGDGAATRRATEVEGAYHGPIKATI